MAISYACESTDQCISCKFVLDLQIYNHNKMTVTSKILSDLKQAVLSSSIVRAALAEKRKCEVGVAIPRMEYKSDSETGVNVPIWINHVEDAVHLKEYEVVR